MAHNNNNSILDETKDTHINQLKQLIEDGLLSFEHGFTKQPCIRGGMVWGIEYKPETDLFIAYANKHYNVYKLKANEIMRLVRAVKAYFDFMGVEY